MSRMPKLAWLLYNIKYVNYTLIFIYMYDKVYYIAKGNIYDGEEVANQAIPHRSN